MIRTPDTAALPILPLAAQLTQQFYAWEQRGRGWLLWDEPVDIEPPFRPFHYYLSRQDSPDDGRKHTWLSRLVERVLNPSLPQTTAADVQDADDDPELVYDSEPALTVELQVTLPTEFDVSKIASEHLLLNLSYCTGPVSFEIIGTKETVVVQWVCLERDASHVTQQLAAHFPEALVSHGRDYMDTRWRQSGGHQLIVDFGLSEEFVRPLRTFRSFDVDPLTGIVGALSRLAPSEIGALQVLFQPVHAPWAQSIVRSVTDFTGGSFFVDAPEMPALAKDKISFPLYAAVVRVAGRSDGYGRCRDIARNLGSALTQYRDPASNELIPLANDDYPNGAHEQDFLDRQSRRSGMLLNSNELLGLVHLPSASVRSERLVRRDGRTRPAPALALGHDLVLGENCHENINTPVTLSADQRIKHIYTVGASGTGKSNFLLNLIGQDLESGQGFAVLDPHGDLVDQVLDCIPDNHVDDVILFDPADEDYPIGFNILSAHSEVEKTLLASDLVAVFHRLSTSWGDQMTTVLSNAIAAFLESEQDGTLADLRRFLAEKEFRKEFLKTVTDSSIVYYWEKEFPLLAGRPQGPILTRLDAFLRPKLIRRMVAQQENRLDFADIMNSGKVLLAKLSQGAIGEENAYLLGTLLVSKFHQLTLSRQAIQETQRRPYYLYIDEFHHFVTPSMAAILSGVRKYRLGLVLAHQELRQLEKRDSEVASAVLTNPYTRVCFRVGDADARKLAEGFGHFEASDLLNLGTGEAICRIERADYDFNLRTPRVAPVDEAVADLRRARVTELSRQRYATPKADVEATLNLQTWAVPAREEIAPEPRPAETSASPANAPVPPIRESAPQTRTEQVPVRRVQTNDGLMGKGGQEHRYLQNLIKRWAEGMGYRATIEKPLPDGAGSVDVALEKDALTIACEISVTTSTDHELGNIQKCLIAGYTHIAVISADPKKLAVLESAARKHVSDQQANQLHFLTVDDLFAFVETLEAESAATEQTVRGYKVKVNYQPVDTDGKKARKRVVSQVIAGAMKRLSIRK